MSYLSQTFFAGGGGGNRAFDSSGNNGALRWNILVRKQKHNVPKAQLKGSYQSGGRILPVMAYTGRLRAKGVRVSFFQALGICKGGDFSIRRILKGTEICHFGL